MSDGSEAKEEPPPLSPILRGVYWFCALCFLVTAGVHVVRAFDDAPDDPSGPLRHSLFVVINLLASAGMLTRPRWLAFPFAVLVLQQLSTHGVRGWKAVSAGQAPIVDDVLVVLFMPAVLGLLIHNFRRKT